MQAAFISAAIAAAASHLRPCQDMLLPTTYLLPHRLPQIPLVWYLTALNAICMLFYFLRQDKSAWQRRLRVPLHLLSYLSFQLLFPQYGTLPGMVKCSSIWERYCAVEALLAHLLWPAAYPAMAAMPLSLVLPLQAATCAMYYSTIPKMCHYSVVECAGTRQQYNSLHRTLTRLANSLPFGLDVLTGDRAFEIKCSTVLTLLVTGTMMIFSLYLAFATELNARQAHAQQVGDRQLHGELRRRQPAVWQILGEVLLATLLVWNVAGMVLDVLYAHTSLLSV